MFKKFGLGGAKCARCGHGTQDGEGYCAQCGATPAAGGHPVVLRDNRWIPAEDELAVFFGMRELRGLFSKTLHVPPTTRAYILQEGGAVEVPQGEYELEGFFSRLNNLLRDRHADILITRHSAFPIDFEFEDLPTAEFLKVGVSFSISVKIELVAAFAQHFMVMPGAVTTAQLRGLLAPSVRQLAAEFIGAQSMREMASSATLRPELDERLQSMLKLRLAQYGLAVLQVDTLSLRHDKYSANREKLGTLWLVLDEKRVQLEHARHFDQLYTEAEWQKIVREEEQVRLRYRRAELQQQASGELAGLNLRAAREGSDLRLGRAELAQEEAERLQAVRARDVELYGRVVEAKSRKEALERGAGEILRELEHELAGKALVRDGESNQWEHVRALAQLKMCTELEIAQLESRSSVAVAQRGMEQNLRRMQAEALAEQARRIEDEAERKAQLERLRRDGEAVRQRDAALLEEEHKGRLLTMDLAAQARAREARRVQDWEDELQLLRKRELLRNDAVAGGGVEVQVAELQEKIAGMKRAGAEAESVSQHQKLLRTMEAQAVFERQAQQQRNQGMLDELAVEQQRQQGRMQEEEARWQAQFRQMLAQQEHAASLARVEIERIGAIGNLSDTGKVALADAANAAVLADLLKTQAHAGMTPEQILAGQAGQSAAAAQAMGAIGVAAAAAGTHGYTPEQALRLAEDRARQERESLERDAERERRHLLEMLQLQNAAQGHALSAQAQLGVGVAQGSGAVHHHHPQHPQHPQHPAGQGGAVSVPCFRGHGNPVDAKFCKECGAPLV